MFFPVENKNKIVIMLLTFFYSNWAHKITLWQSFKTYFYVNYLFCFFSRIQNKNSYYVLNILIFRIGLKDYLMTMKTHFYVNYSFVCFLVVKNNKKLEYVVDNIIFRTSYPINLWKSLKTHFYVYYLFDYFLIVKYNRKWEYVVDNIIFGPS